MASPDLSTLKLPFRGRLYPAAEKKFAETILFVPFFGGSQKALERHREFVNRIGFDCVLFDLNDRTENMHRNLLSADLVFGLKHNWALQIERILNEIPGKKILYTFSTPSTSAIEATARRNAYDISGIVCDGGPPGDFWKAFVNYFTFERPLPTWPAKAAAALTVTLLWNPNFKKVLGEDLKKLPNGFHLLSIRGWKDKLITPAMIDQAFEGQDHLDWRKLALPEAGHLNGLKEFSSEYEPAVAEFLASISQRID